MSRTCKRGHEMTPENTYVRPDGRGRECRTCIRARGSVWRAAHPGSSTDHVRAYRKDPEKRERDRERSRRWKREHLGQPGRPAVTSDRTDKTPGNQSDPATAPTVRGHGNQERGS